MSSPLLQLVHLLALEFWVLVWLNFVTTYFNIKKKSMRSHLRYQIQYYVSNIHCKLFPRHICILINYVFDILECSRYFNIKFSSRIFNEFDFCFRGNSRIPGNMFMKNIYRTCPTCGISCHQSKTNVFIFCRVLESRHWNQMFQVSKLQWVL